MERVQGRRGGGAEGSFYEWAAQGGKTQGIGTRAGSEKAVCTFLHANGCERGGEKRGVERRAVRIKPKHICKLSGMRAKVALSRKAGLAHDGDCGTPVSYAMRTSRAERL